MRDSATLTAASGASLPCPPFCTRDHSGELVEVDGFLLGRVHDRIVAEVTAGDPSAYSDPATAAVYVERSDEDGLVLTAPRVVLTLTAGSEGSYPGSVGVQGWTGSVQQTMQLISALMEGMVLAEAASR